MIFRRFYDENLAQASYLIACEKSREAIVVDPNSDVGLYTRTMETRFVRHSAPDGRDYYWLCGAEVWHGDPCDSDLEAMLEGYVAITPLHLLFLIARHQSL